MELTERIKKLAKKHGRYGYRRIAVMLRREGTLVNTKRIHRIWKLERLQIPCRRPKRRRYGPKEEVVNKAQYSNHVWSYDFMEDRTKRGNKLRLLNVIDEFTKECLVTRVEPSMLATKVIATLS